MRRISRLTLCTRRAFVYYLAIFLYLGSINTPEYLTHVGVQKPTYSPARGFCHAPTLSIAVLTMDRSHSLKRLLSSLQRVRYSCSRVHLSIYIDIPRGLRLMTPTLFRWQMKSGGDMVEKMWCYSLITSVWQEIGSLSRQRIWMTIYLSWKTTWR